MNRKAVKATISDVAKAASTGKTSVSRYLNGELNALSADLKTRIEQAIAALNYRPSQMARGLKRGRTRLIGLIIADITNPYSVNVLSGIEAACRAHGFTLLMCNTNNEVDLEKHYLNLLNSYQVEGIVVNAVGMREEALNQLQQSLLPMTLIDRKIPEFECDVVGLDNHAAAVLSTEHLLEQGYRALLFISEPLGLVNTRLERVHSFRQRMAQQPELVAEQAEISLSDPTRLDAVLSDFYQRHRGIPCAVMVVNG
ncbi:MAG TPA: LacI family transcriptional regulator, partial [Erwinia persicina]|nr:LacI family transcriptional regulator [Erwinia persicina]